MSASAMATTGACMRFNVGCETQWGTSNDVFGLEMSSSRSQYLAGKTFDQSFCVTSKSAAAHVRQLVSHNLTYHAHGLVVINPASLQSSGCIASDVDLHDAESKFAELRDLVFDVARSSRLEAIAPSKVVCTEAVDIQPANRRELMLEDYHDFYVIPRFLALAMFGPIVYHAHVPAWITTSDLARRVNDALSLVTMSVDHTADNTSDTTETLVYNACRASSKTRSPPKPSKLVEVLGEMYNHALGSTLCARFCTDVLGSTLTLRKGPTDQLAIVAAGIHQLRASMAQYSTTPIKHAINHHLPGVVLIVPCGIGKTNIAISIWLGMFDPAFADLATNDFGTVYYQREQVHNGYTRTPNAYDRWLAAHPTAHVRAGVTNKALRMLFIVEGNPLVNQAIACITRIVPGVRVGRLQASSRPKPELYDVVVASLDTIAAQDDFPAGYFDNFGLVIIDEAHTCLTEASRTIFGKVAAPLQIMLTATPRRHELRFFGGPLVVVADRPSTQQENLIILRANLDASDKQEIVSKYGYAAKRAGNGKTAVDTTAMALALAYNLERNDFCARVIYDLVMAPNQDSVAGLGDRYRLHELASDGQVDLADKELYRAVCSSVNHYNADDQSSASKCRSDPVPFMDSAWPSLQNRNNQARLLKTQTLGHIVSEHEPALKRRHPIVFTQHVPHCIILMHMFAQIALDRHAESTGRSKSEFMIARIGLRRLALIDKRVLAEHEHVQAEFRTLDPTHVSATRETEGPLSSRLQTRIPKSTGSGGFDIDYFRSWFAMYPPSFPYASEHGIKPVFLTDAQQKKRKDLYRPPPAVPQQAGVGTIPPPAPSTKKSKWPCFSLDNSSWTYSSQFFWTPLYGALPQALVWKAPKAGGKKRAHDQVMPDNVKSDGSYLHDTRPDLFAIPGLVLLTFGLVIGMSNDNGPKEQLYGGETTGISARECHLQEALQSDFIFANYQTASTGLDVDTLDTSFDVMPVQSDDEQRRGRAMREGKDKQSTLHVRFGETYSLYPNTTVKQLVGTSGGRRPEQTRIVIAERMKSSARSL